MTGAAAGIYAVSLAGVTAQQSATDARLAAARDPIATEIAEQRSSHARLETAVERAATTYADAADAYAALLKALGSHEAAIAALGQEVAAAEGSAASLVIPARPALPVVRASAGTRAAPRPAANASTGASGGG
jgi:septal ring factor EnvC (AmiA/AmiB activator)